jgi:hypothetical protein
MGDYKTTCTECGAEDQLEIHSGHFRATGMRLTPDGFAFADAKQVDTEEEIVRCLNCKRLILLSEFMEG